MAGGEGAAQFTAGLLFPLNTAALPLFLLLQKIGMNDNLFGVALPEAAFSLPVTIVILRPFMRAIPAELEDAATVDGATRIRFFVRILLLNDMNPGFQDVQASWKPGFHVLSDRR